MTEQATGSAGQKPGGWSKWLLVATAALGLAAVVYLGVDEARQSRLVPEGSAAPSFQMERYGGGTLSLAELKGKVVMLDFWATWCPPCQEEMPALVKLAKEYESRGLVFVAASRDDLPMAVVEVEAYVKGRMPELAPYVVYAPDEVARAFQVNALPTLYFLDEQGRVVDSQRGALSEDAIRRRIERALGL